MKPTVAVIPLQGTILLTGTSRVDLAWYGEAGTRVSTSDFLEAIPELDEVADIRQFEFREGVPSYELVDADWVEFAELVNQLVARDDIDGVVVTHGTGNLEETAFFLDLVADPDKPIVLTGAMRPSTGLGGDGALNFLNAVRTAASADSRGLGVLVVLNDTIFAARDATKSSTFRVNTFDARDLGPLGYADADGEVVYYHRPVRSAAARPRFTLPPGSVPARVDVVLSYINADGVGIDAFVAAGARGIVNAGGGNGKAPAGQVAAMRAAVEQGILVCNASRCGEGRVVRTPAMRELGAVTCGNLLPWKARILLSLALLDTSDPDAIQAMFDDT